MFSGKPIRKVLIVDVAIPIKRIRHMAFDDPIVWLLIVAAVVLFFGASRIPKFARSLGEARREFNKGSNPDATEVNPRSTVAATMPPPAQSTSETLSPDDPLYTAAQNEGIDIRGKTRSQVATELAWKLNKK